MSTDEAAPAHEETRRGEHRVIVVSSQPEARDQELPPQRLRSLGAVAAHATEPVSAERSPRSTGRRSGALLALLSTSVPLALAAWGIRFLDGRTVILVATAVLAIVLVAGLVAAWRALGPGGRSTRGGVWMGRAVGLVLGGFVAFYLLVNTVTALL